MFDRKKTLSYPAVLRIRDPRVKKAQDPGSAILLCFASPAAYHFVYMQPLLLITICCYFVQDTERKEV
jgi:hypothetical protein